MGIEASRIRTRTRAEPAAAAPAPSAPAAGVDAEDVARVSLTAWEAHRQLCRHDVNAFCEHVLRDDKRKDVHGEPALVEQPDHLVRAHAELDRHRRVVMMMFPESGKTNSFGVGRPLFKLGNNHNARGMLLGNTQKGTPTRTLASIKKYVERSEALREIFPDLLPGEKWSETEIVVRRDVYSKDPSLRAVGYDTDVGGARADFAVVDDLTTRDNTSTPAQRAALESYFDGTFLTRLTEEAEVAFLCNAWHPQDLSMTLAKRGWKFVRVPVLVGNPQRSAWDLVYPMRRIRALTEDGPERISSLEFARKYMAKAIDDGARTFTPAAIERSKRNGIGYGFVHALPRIPDGCVVVTGVDLSSGKRNLLARREAARTVLFTLLVHPNEDRQIIHVVSGRWGAREILDRVVDVGVRFGGIVVVENNGAQQYIVDLAREHQKAVVPILPFTTGNNKADPRFGVESLSAEMEGGRWSFPCMEVVRGDGVTALVGTDEIEMFVADLENYTPFSHTGDHLMSAWLAREGARHVLRGRVPGQGDGGSVGVRVFGEDRVGGRAAG